MTKLRLLSALAIMLFLTNCSGMKSEASYPKSDQQINDERYGKLTGEDGIVFGGGKKHVATGITVIGLIIHFATEMLRPRRGLKGDSR